MRNSPFYMHKSQQPVKRRDKHEDPVQRNSSLSILERLSGATALHCRRFIAKGYFCLQMQQFKSITRKRDQYSKQNLKFIWVCIKRFSIKCQLYLVVKFTLIWYCSHNIFRRRCTTVLSIGQSVIEWAIYIALYIGVLRLKVKDLIFWTCTSRSSRYVRL